LLFICGINYEKILSHCILSALFEKAYFNINPSALLAKWVSEDKWSSLLFRIIVDEKGQIKFSFNNLALHRI
jgi:hypothetical protein